MTNDMSLAAWILFLICFIGLVGGFAVAWFGRWLDLQPVIRAGVWLFLVGWVFSIPALIAILFT